ncbi:hypothetical protein [Pedobacter antarcticus]|uniref:hypothetical protein n=1 Tax=Pedobacter antarcticus TaxID=34086 RepID=UPI000882CA36|nr:hypothetical protein [Pedobacter antarcticus]SDM79608.1 hypothetical protein SAMN04488084_11416 [Pedobacter antarcticus]
MKKTVLIMLLSIVTLGISSCKKEVFVPNDGIPNQTLLKYVASGDWRISPDNNTYSVTIPVGEIDRGTFENDNISLMISRGDNDVYDGMPYSDEASGDNYSFDITPGSVTIYYQNKYSVPPARPNLVTRVKIVLTTSSL